LQKELDLKTSYLRLRAFPFNQQLPEFVKRHKRVYVVEQNRDGQMCDLIRAAVWRDCNKVRSVRHYTGIPIDARSVTEEIVAQESGN